MKVETSYYSNSNSQYDFDKTKAQSAPSDKVEVEKKKQIDKQELKPHETKQQVDPQEIKSQESVLSREKLEKVAEQLQEFVGSLNKSINFAVDNDSGKDIIKVVDKTSGEIIRQIPSEEVLGLVTQLSNASTGKLIDTSI